MIRRKWEERRIIRKNEKKGGVGGGEQVKKIHVAPSITRPE
jgi:hypothetical protein